MQIVKFMIPVVVLLSACATVEVGQNFDLAAFQAKVQRGVTTQEDVRAWLGAPAGVGTAMETSGERFEQWTYYSGSGDLPNMKGAHLKMLQIKFDQQGVVRAYNWTSDRH